jgi:hypothetical protein
MTRDLIGDLNDLFNCSALARIGGQGRKVIE